MRARSAMPTRLLTGSRKRSRNGFQMGGRPGPLWRRALRGPNRRRERRTLARCADCRSRPASHRQSQCRGAARALGHARIRIRDQRGSRRPKPARSSRSPARTAASAHVCHGSSGRSPARRSGPRGPHRNGASPRRCRPAGNDNGAADCFRGGLSRIVRCRDD